jgi:hypothetical protein
LVLVMPNASCRLVLPMTMAAGIDHYAASGCVGRRSHRRVVAGVPPVVGRSKKRADKRPHDDLPASGGNAIRCGCVRIDFASPPQWRAGAGRERKR